MDADKLNMDADELKEEIRHQHELLKEYRKQMRVLQLQAAKFGDAYVPAHIRIEIDGLADAMMWTGREITNYDHQLSKLQGSSKVQGKSDKNHTILIIEDERAFSLLLEVVLRDYGYNVFVAHDGVEGLRIAAIELPDIILLDIQMPAMNGYETFENIKSKKIRTRIMMMTRSADIDTVVYFMKRGACDYMVKPFLDLRAFVDRIRRSLEIDEVMPL
jgi:CheY-like chemotaxis protein